MKAKFFVLVALVVLSLSCVSCTERTRAKQFGGHLTVNLPKGKKLVNATWKEANLWYLVEDMEDGYVPKTKYFIEEAEFNVWNGEIKFVESR